jgi:hypothetical protein
MNKKVPSLQKGQILVLNCFREFKMILLPEENSAECDIICQEISKMLRK